MPCLFHTVVKSFCKIPSPMMLLYGVSMLLKMTKKPSSRLTAPALPASHSSLHFRSHSLGVFAPAVCPNEIPFVECLRSPCAQWIKFSTQVQTTTSKRPFPVMKLKTPPHHPTGPHLPCLLPLVRIAFSFHLLVCGLQCDLSVVGNLVFVLRCALALWSVLDTQWFLSTYLLEDEYKFPLRTVI